MISIITCNKNTGLQFIAECIESLARQPPVFEWIFIDDGSERGYREELESLLFETAAVRTVLVYVALPASIGLSAARNLAFGLAKGSTFYVLDADDRIPTSFLHRLTTIEGTFDLLAVESLYFCDAFCEHRKIASFKEKFLRHGASFLDPFLWWDFYYHGLIASRRAVEIINGYRWCLRIGEDQDVLFRIVESCQLDKVLFLSEIGYEYRANPNGICSTMPEQVLSGYSVSMLEASARRGIPATATRFAGTEQIDGGTVDVYEFLIDNKWQSWASAHALISNL